MKKLLFTFTLLILLIVGTKAQVVVTPGTFPTMCQGQGYVTQTSDIIITETLTNDFRHVNYQPSTITFDAPLGYEFAPNVGTVTFLSGRDISVSMIVNTYSVVIYIGNITTFSFLDQLKVSGLSVRALIGASSSLNLYNTAFGGAANVTGDNYGDGISHGTLTSIPYTLTVGLSGVLCSDDSTPLPIDGTPGTGVFSGTGVSGSNFISSVAGVGTKVITYTTIVSGCTYSKSTSVVVKAPPTVAISRSPLGLLCPNTNVTFTGAATGSNKRYQFLVNGIPVTTLSATTTYSTSALQEGDLVTVMVDNGIGTCQKISTPINMTFVSPATVTISLPTLPVLVCNNTVGSFAVTKNPLGGTLTGAGISGSTFSPSLAGAGTHTISYAVLVSGCNYTATKDITVNPAPTAVISSSDVDNIICKGDLVTFTANTTGLVSRYEFHSGGNIAFGHPQSSNIFDTTGLKNGDAVYVRVDNGSNTCEAVSNIIPTIVGEIPKAFFKWYNGCGSFDINYKDESPLIVGANVITRKWDFENDGTFDNIISANPTNTFSLIQDYNTRFIVVTDKGCSDTLVKKVTVTPGFTITPDAPYSVIFANSKEYWFPKDTTISSWGWGVATGNVISTGSRNVWSTGSNVKKRYNEGEISFLNSPCFDFTSLDRPMITLKLWSEGVSGLSGVMLESSIDDGLTWYVVGKKDQGDNWYNNVSGISGLSNITPTQTHPNNEGWTGTDATWKNAKFVLDNLAGKSSVRFRLSFGAPRQDTITIRKGFAVDSVWIGNRNKTILIEHFTNNEQYLSCNALIADPKRRCSAANDSVNKIQSLRPLDVVSIHNHTSFPKIDNFNLLNPADPSSRVLYYGVAEPPMTHLDGQRYDKYGSQDSLDVIDVDKKALERAKFKIDLSVYTIGTKVRIATRVNYIDDIPLGTPKIPEGLVVQMVVLEENKTDNSKNYKYVLRKMLPDAAGNYYGKYWVKNDMIELVNEWDAINVNPSEMSVIVFVQNSSTKEVYQAVYRKGAGTTGNVVTSNTQGIWQLNDIFVYPNPSTEEFTVLIGTEENQDYRWELFDNLGKLVLTGSEKHTNNFNVHTNNLSNGLYTLKVFDKSNGSTQKKIIIAH